MSKSRDHEKKQQTISSSNSVTLGNEIRLPPEAKNTERALLGIMMLDRDRIDIITGHLTEEMFYLDNHRTIYRAMMRLNNRSQAITIFSVTDELRNYGELDIVGGPYYITVCTNDVTSVTDAVAEQYCLVIKQAHMQRELIRIGAEIHYSGFNGKDDVFEMLDRAETAILGISANLTDDTYTMDASLMSTLQLIEKNRAMNTLVTGVPSGFITLDRVTRGFQEDDLIIIGARPSVGKTAFALNIARAAARAGHPGAYISLEMSKERLTLRLLAAEAEMDIHGLQVGRLDDAQMKALHEEGVRRLSKLPLHIDDSSGMNLMKLRGKLRRLKKKFRIEWAIIDYLQLMDGEGQIREQQIASLSRGLKKIAKELHISVIALSQLSREIERRTNGEPVLADLRESGAIEQDADMVMFLWGPSEKDIEKDPTISDDRMVRIAKARDGNLTRLTLTFAGNIQTFKEKGAPLVPMSGRDGQKPITNKTLF
jgi:replicative DNA helicase